MKIIKIHAATKLISTSSFKTHHASLSNAEMIMSNSLPKCMPWLFARLFNVRMVDRWVVVSLNRFQITSLSKTFLWKSELASNNHHSVKVKQGTIFEVCQVRSISKHFQSFIKVINCFSEIFSNTGRNSLDLSGEDEKMWQYQSLSFEK